MGEGVGGGGYDRRVVWRGVGVLWFCFCCFYVVLFFTVLSCLADTSFLPTKCVGCVEREELWVSHFEQSIVRFEKHLFWSTGRSEIAWCSDGPSLLRVAWATVSLIDLT